MKITNKSKRICWKDAQFGKAYMFASSMETVLIKIGTNEALEMYPNCVAMNKTTVELGARVFEVELEIEATIK